VVDEVRAYGVVDAELEGDLELGADAIAARNQDGVGKPGEIEGEEAAEASDLRQDVLVEGLAGQHLDALLGAIAFGDVDACVGVGDGGWGVGFGVGVQLFGHNPAPEFGDLQSSRANFHQA
jgi:hypothetical protein